jgi:CheY-like chemotaxis protein
MNDTPSGLHRSTQEAMEIRLWEIYLIRNRNNLYKTLSDYSLDRGPLQKSDDIERVSFRFMRYDWERTIRAILADNSVPFEIVRTLKIDVIQHMTKKKVYLAEDDLNILFALNTMLEDAGYDVLLSNSGNPIMESHLPATDLFILDKHMPDVDGVDLCRHLKSQPSTKHIPVIMISASSNFKDQALKAGVDECLEKPFQMHDLLKLVSKYTAEEVQHADHP